MSNQEHLILQLLLYRDTDRLLDAITDGKQSSEQLLTEFTRQDYLLGQKTVGYYGTDDQQLVGYNTLQPDSADSRVSLFHLLYAFSRCHLAISHGIPICRYRHLLSWQELSRLLGENILSTSFLAKTDLDAGLRSDGRINYQWPAYLHHDNEALNQLMQKEVSELHAHLKGSTLNFELSWLSLMNQICGRSESFKKLAEHTVMVNPLRRGGAVHDLYMLITIAASIRLQLYQKLNKQATAGDDAQNLFYQLLAIESSDYAAYERRHLQSEIDVVRHQYAYHYTKGSQCEVPDYAIPTHQQGLLTVLTGERWLLYQMFRRVYDEGYKNTYSQLLFYLYLHIKTLFRNEIIQTNPQIGFHNFSIYEQRKDLFIPDGSVYERLTTLLALGTFLDENSGKRYMESRIKPKNTSGGNYAKLFQMEQELKNNPYGVNVDEWQHALIYHFIKVQGQRYTQATPRHHALRHEVKLQAKSICTLHEEKSSLCDRIVGVDAANSEIYSRPEVFAQAFRYLRRESSLHSLRPTLGMTYHVGEDFYDIASGLRAVDEVIRYLGFCANDRLGHALVLGTDVSTYYDKRGYELRGTEMELLDNAVWLYFQGQKISGSETVCHFLYNYANSKFLEIYEEESFDINSYYGSWQLRGDAPEYYLQDEGEHSFSAVQLSIDPWIRYSFNDNKFAATARKNKTACHLYAKYHYNRHVREAGDKTCAFRLPHSIRKEYMLLLEQIQQRMLTRLERLHIAIECNPSSNYKIGEMERYDEHPILKFYNFGIKTPYPTHEVSVSINTDDSGVFATSLDREYALMALALEKRQDEAFGNTPRAVVEWLNRVRKMSVEQRFVKDI